MSRFICLLLLAFILPVSAYALNEGGVITGLVTDKITRQPILGANILVVETGTGDATDASGIFTISGLEPGVYSIRVSYLGYQSVTRTDIVVSNVSFTKLTVTLEPQDLELEAVEITSSYYRTSTDAVTSLQNFSYEEIRRAPGGNEDIIRAISVVPGVAAQANGRNDLVVRGGGPTENLFLIDGLEVPNINHFGTQGATGGPLSLINLDFVDGTDFSTGGFGVRYGDRLSSVTSISLREARTDRWGGKATISGSQFGANAEGPLGTAGSNMHLSVRRSYLDWIFKAAGFGFIPQYWDFQTKVVYPISNTDRLDFFAIGALDDVIFNSDTREKRLSNSQILGSDQNQYVTGLTWRRVSSSGLFTLTGGRTYVDFSSQQADTTGAIFFDNQSFEAETSLRGEYITRLTPVVELTVGSQLKRVETNSKLFLNNFTDRFGSAFNGINSDNTLTGWKWAGYFQTAHEWSNQFDYTVGLRTDYFSELRNEWSLSPRLAAGFNMNELTRFTGSVGLYHQTPQLTWLANNPTNRQLDQIRVVQTVFGFERMLRFDTRLRVEVFQKNYRNYPASVVRPYLVLSNAGAGFGGGEDGFSNFGFEPLVSQGKGYSQGIEFSVQKKLSEVRCYGIASLTISEAYFTAVNGKEYKSSYMQPVLFNLSGGYQIDNHWEVALKFRAASGLPYTPFNPDGSRDMARYNQDQLAVTHQLDVRVDRRWNFTGWNLITYLDVQNLYNRNNEFSASWDIENNEVSRSAGIGILPVIGISAEF